ncbi:uncharacterized protein LOC116417953 [Nasonia vitripennis]|uniref:Uncharacterized protein n=1 Tax=Nasonia vitripennis TaxID=7425 RepID=A0A7M7QKW0_NASVI|nr:uncharacterized protein LOC116417953 [Nasonia vitripennis]
MSMLDAKWNTLQERHEQILAIKTAADESKTYFKKEFFDNFEEIYIDQRAKFLDALAALEERAAPGTESDAHPERKPAVRKLPPISLPQFSGKYSDWSSFKDMFTAFMKRDNDLQDVERLYYLKSCLSGEAADLLKNVSITDDNYNRAWSRLKDHYENKRALINLCMNSLLEIAAVSRESYKALKTLRDATAEAIEMLQTLGRPVEHMDDFLVNLTVRRFDTITQRD